MSQENIRTADKINASIHDKQNFEFNVIRYWNRKEVNIYWNIIKIFSIFHFLFVLYDEAFENMQQHQKLIKYKCLCEWYHTANLWANYWEKLSDF